MWRTQQSPSHVMKATEVVVILPVRMMGTGPLQACLTAQVSLYNQCIIVHGTYVLYMLY